MAEMVKSAFKVLADPNAVARLITDHVLITRLRQHYVGVLPTLRLPAPYPIDARRLCGRASPRMRKGRDRRRARECASISA